MKSIRYYLLALVVLAPAMAFAQADPDSIHVAIGGNEYPGWGAAFGERFEMPPATIPESGTLPLVAVESDGDPKIANQGCTPLVNGAEVAGNIAWISRGTCAFVDKVTNASNAGAVAVVVYNDDRNGDPDPSLVLMGGDCTPEEGCDIPAMFVSRASSLAINDEIKFGEEASLISIRVTEPPEPPALANIEGTTTQTTVFEDGFIGNDFSFGNGLGFTFNGEQGLFVGSVLVGIDGDVTSNPYDGISEFERGSVETLTTFPSPFGEAEAGARSTFSSDNVEVTLSGYAYDGYVIYDMNVENTSGGTLEDVYLGLFADFDAGPTTSTDDNAGVNEDENLVYVYDELEGSAYFGIASLTDDLSGYNADATAADDTQLFDALTLDTEPGADPAERAAAIGVGPFTMLAGESEVVRFAMVAGADEPGIVANTQAARGVATSVEEITQAGRFALASAYPNPFASKTTIEFELPVAQDVRLAVYDVLGRQVATLVDGVQQAGKWTVEFDATDLPSGVYVYRLEAGETQLAERVTVVR